MFTPVGEASQDFQGYIHEKTTHLNDELFLWMGHTVVESNVLLNNINLYRREGYADHVTIM